MARLISELVWDDVDTDYSSLVLRDVVDEVPESWPPSRADGLQPLEETECAEWDVYLECVSGVGWMHLPRNEQYDAPHVRAQVWDEEPPPDEGDWDLVVEVPWTSTSGRLRQEWVIDVEDLESPVIELGSPGDWRLRAHRSPLVDEDSVERWLLQLWVAPVAQPRWLRRPVEPARSDDPELADSWSDSGWFDLLPWDVRDLVWPLHERPMSKEEYRSYAAELEEREFFEQSVWTWAPAPWPSGDADLDARADADAEECNRQTRAAQERLGLASARLGLPAVPETWGDAFDFLVAAGVFVPRAEEPARFTIAEHPPLAHSVLPELFDLDQTARQGQVKLYGVAAGDLAFVTSWMPGRQLETTLGELAELVMHPNGEVAKALRLAEQQGVLSVETLPGGALRIRLTESTQPTDAQEPLDVQEFLAQIRAATPPEVEAENQARLRDAMDEARREALEQARAAGTQGPFGVTAFVMHGRAASAEPTFVHGPPPPAGLVTYEGVVLQVDPDGTWQPTHHIARYPYGLARTVAGMLAPGGPLVMLKDDGGQEPFDKSFENFRVSANGGEVLLSDRRGRGRNQRGRLTLLSLADGTRTETLLPGSDVPFLVGLGGGLAWAAQHVERVVRNGARTMRHYRWRPGEEPEALPYTVSQVDPISGATLEYVQASGESVIRTFDGNVVPLRIGGRPRLLPGADGVYVATADALIVHTVDGSARPRRLPFPVHHNAMSLMWEDPTHCVSVETDHLLRLDIDSGEVEKYDYPEDVGYQPSVIAPILAP